MAAWGAGSDRAAGWKGGPRKGLIIYRWFNNATLGWPRSGRGGWFSALHPSLSTTLRRATTRAGLITETSARAAVFTFPLSRAALPGLTPGRVFTVVQRPRRLQGAFTVKTTSEVCVCAWKWGRSPIFSNRSLYTDTLPPVGPISQKLVDRFVFCFQSTVTECVATDTYKSFGSVQMSPTVFKTRNDNRTTFLGIFKSAVLLREGCIRVEFQS